MVLVRGVCVSLIYEARSAAYAAMDKCDALRSQGKHCPAEVLAAAEEEARVLRAEYYGLTGVVMTWSRR